MNFVNTFDQLVNIAQIVRKCPTITLSRAFTAAYRDFANQSQYLRLSVAGVTVADQRQYSLGNDPYLDIIGINGMQASQVINGNTQFWAVNPSDGSLWDPNFSSNASTTMPVRYQYIPQAQFALDPIPKGVFDLLVGVIVQPKEGADQVPQSALLKYASDIEAGALAYLLDIPGQPWTNPALAMKYAGAFRSGISNAKADVQRSFNVGSVRARPRRFLVG